MICGINVHFLNLVIMLNDFFFAGCFRIYMFLFDSVSLPSNFRTEEERILFVCAYVIF